MLLKPPRGTRDFYPEDLRLREWLFGRFRGVSLRFGFEEVDAPVVETAELCERKAGEEIAGQVFSILPPGQREGRERLVLRPEFTPSLARMIYARRGQLRLPLRWFALPQCWRYERPGRGRRREHYQWNMDIWGEPDVTAEAELLAAIFAALDDFGLPPGAVRMRINHRGLLDEMLRERFLRERPEAFKPLCIVIDKLEKIGREAVEEQLCDPAGPLGKARLSQPDAREVTTMLELRGIEEVARSLGKRAENSAAIAELRRLWELLDSTGLAGRVEFDGSVVRGLAYYTGVVFEASDAAGRFRAICGGGRYDGMLGELDPGAGKAGAKGLPAVGFGFGDAVIVELLRAENLLPNAARRLDAVVYPMGETERPAAMRLAAALRAQGRAVELLLGTPKARRAFADADRAGAARVYLIGPDELARKAVRVKELASGAEHEEPLPG